MAWNSQPQGLTAAQQQAGTQINPINMQGVVAAILEHQQMQQRQQQLQQQQIQQGLNSFAQQYEQQQNDDLANRAIYQAKYPGDPYSGQAGYDERVPDYGGTNAMHMQQIQAELQYKQAEAQQAAAHADYWKNHPQGSGEDASGMYQPNVYTDPQTGQRYIIGKNGVPHPMKESSSLGSSTITADDLAQIDASKSDVTTNSKGTPQTYTYTMKDGRQFVLPASQVGKLGSLMHGNRGASMYQDLLNPPPGATSSSHTSTRAGAGPTQDAIAYLQQHPELASAFDQKYGQGQAATYLGQ